MFRRTIDKWRLKYLNNKIDKLLHDNDSKIGRKFRHNNKLKRILLMLMPFLPLTFFISLLIIVIFLIIRNLYTFSTFYLLAFFLPILLWFTCCFLEWGSKIQSEGTRDYYSPVLAAMNRWFFEWDVKDDRPDSERIMSACYAYLLHEDVNELFKDSELFTDAEYGRLVKPILAYIKVCLTVDRGTDSKLMEEFIKETDLDQFLHEMMECKSKRESELNKSQSSQDNNTKDRGIEEIKNVTRMIGMDKLPKEVSESVEIRRLNNVINELKKTNGQFATTIKKMESN